MLRRVQFQVSAVPKRNVGTSQVVNGLGIVENAEPANRRAVVVLSRHLEQSCSFYAVRQIGLTWQPSPPTGSNSPRCACHTDQYAGDSQERRKVGGYVQDLNAREVRIDQLRCNALHEAPSRVAMSVSRRPPARRVLTTETLLPRATTRACRVS